MDLDFDDYELVTILEALTHYKATADIDDDDRSELVHLIAKVSESL